MQDERLQKAWMEYLKGYLDDPCRFGDLVDNLKEAFEAGYKAAKKGE